jgi:hypothetical protein
MAPGPMMATVDCVVVSILVGSLRSKPQQNSVVQFQPKPFAALKGESM